MGRVGNISRDLYSAPARSGVRSSRISKKDIANKPAGPRSRTRSAKAASARKRTEESFVEEPLVIEEFDSVWKALGFGPEESANLEARASLMRQIEAIVKESHWTQAQAAKHCGVSQPRINDLLRGRINKFSVDALVNMAGALGRRIDFQLIAA